jgi:hypothetical protein
MQTGFWLLVLLFSGLLDGVINIWAFRYAQRVDSVVSVEFLIFILLGTLVYMFSIGLFLASMVGAPARPGFTFIWPVSVVLFTAIVLRARGEIELSTWQWAVGTLLALLPLVFWSWIGEQA